MVFRQASEANSGNDVSQGTVGLATAKTSLTSVPVVASNNVELALLNLVSLGSDEGSDAVRDDGA